MVFPGAAASSSLALNGHRVNPLKVYPSAAVTRQSRVRKGRRAGTEGKKKEGREKTTTGSEKEKVQLESAVAIMQRESKADW